MTPGPRWHHAVLGSFALVCAAVALGLVLEHTTGPGWAAGDSRPRFVAAHHGPSHASSSRIPPDVKQRLLKGPRVGGRFGGFSPSNVHGLIRAIVIQLAIAALVVLLMLCWRVRRRRRRLA